MGELTRLMARDGHEFDAWLAAPPPGQPRGALVILQEIFGVNSHIRAVTDGFAAEGYVTIAPSLFDRAKRGVQLGYTPEDVQHGSRLRAAASISRQVLLDINACINVVRHAGPVAAVGYCWGGTLAHLVACELPVAAAVAYYGIAHRREPRQAARTRRCMYHFGERDKSIPPEAIEKIRAADPAGEIPCLPGGPRLQLRPARRL